MVLAMGFMGPNRSIVVPYDGRSPIHTSHNMTAAQLDYLSRHSIG
jgi:hypothetical protein